MADYRLKCQEDCYRKYKDKLLDEIDLHPFNTTYDIVIDCQYTSIGYTNDHTAADQLANRFIKDGYQAQAIYNCRSFLSVYDVLRITL